jgi:hypothetical protein
MSIITATMISRWPACRKITDLSEFMIHFYWNVWG